MFEILEEMGLTVGEVIGAGLVFAGFGAAIAVLSNYGYLFVELLVG